MGHVRMMGAIQPFLSGAISKTVNMPEAATAEEIEQVYLEGWKRGLKAIAIYRDNSKRSQPLSTGKKKNGDAAVSEADSAVIEGLKKQLAIAQAEAVKPHRRLPERPRSRTSSRSPDTRATSPSGSTRTASPARSSSRWPRKAPRSRV